MFPLVFALVGSQQGSSKTLWLVVAALTTTSLVGMYGSVASGLESAPELAPRLAPSNNAISDAAFRLFRSDLMITVGSLLNIGALLALAGALWLPKREPSPARSAQPPPQSETLTVEPAALAAQ